MSKYFITESDRAGSEQWCLLAFDGDNVSETIGELKDLSARVGSEPVIGLMSAADVGCLRSKIAGRSEAQIRQAAPYTVEEDLVDDVDKLSFKVLATERDGQRALLAYDGTLVEALCENLQNNGFRVSAIVPDSALLGGPDNAATAIVGAHFSYLNFGTDLFTRTSNKLLGLILAKLVTSQNITQISITIADDHNDTEALIEDIRNNLNGLANPPQLKIAESAASALCDLVAKGAKAANYSRYDLMPASLREAGKAGKFNRWGLALAAGIGGLALIAHIGFSIKANADKQAWLSELKSRQEIAFKNAFPEVKRVVNAEAQAKQLLAELREQGPPPADFLNVFYRSTELLANQGDGVKLVGFSFADGVMILRMESDDISRLEKYRGELSGFLTAEVVSAESSDDVVRGAIRVRPN